MRQLLKVIEVHPNPQNALSDGQQSINFDTFSKLMKEINGLAELLNKKFLIENILNK